jgi:RHS repeat-associated protein
VTEPQTRTKYAYDANGNTATEVVSSATTTFAWDYENRLTSVTLPGSAGTVSFKYDPFGRRIYKSSSTATSIYAYDGDNLIEETNSSGTSVARYSQGLNIDEPLALLRSSTTSYYQADGLGSITSLSNGAGALAQTYTFDSFGKQTASSGSLTNPFQYTARESDPETGLYYYRARYYDPTLGRFLREDPIRFSAGVNFYEYVMSSPLNHSDPLGLCPNSCPQSGNAPSPRQYQAMGSIAQGSWFFGFGIGAATNLASAAMFKRGWPLDAQVIYGGSPAYANYVYGVYMCAAGYPLPFVLAAANMYGAHFSKYTSNTQMDPNYPAIPASNVANIIQGCKDQKNRTLCTPN